ncbi:MAG: toll/interleukin-1 receptor domain-containing protein [Clostridia bacterium]|nr:toll/interleukin-1 receptor domain-containing protein [Bacteroidales bacterium]MBR3918962.1 toll/interleukin-1 receptor domain-containing protein [Clostridia bacterium]
MRKVFISYSIEDRNLHLITLLLEHLRKNNFDVVVSNPGMDSTMRIINANLFIGIVTNNSNSINYVINEWRIANRNNIQKILIVEDGVTINDSNISYIRFSRSNPQKAINELFNLNKSEIPAPKKKKDSDDTLSNVLTGVAIIAGVAALISLLSKDK